MYWSPSRISQTPLLSNLYTTDQPTTDHTITFDFADDRPFSSLHSDPETPKTWELLEAFDRFSIPIRTLTRKSSKSELHNPNPENFPLVCTYLKI